MLLVAAREGLDMREKTHYAGEKVKGWCLSGGTDGIPVLEECEVTRTDSTLFLGRVEAFLEGSITHHYVMGETFFFHRIPGLMALHNRLVDARMAHHTAIALLDDKAEEVLEEIKGESGSV
jgi:hypothetical protein